MAVASIDTAKIFTEAGWLCAEDSWYPNSQYYLWKPNSKETEDIYAFDYCHFNDGNTVIFVWADTLEEAKALADSTDKGVPTFSFKTEEELLVLIKCVKN